MLFRSRMRKRERKKETQCLHACTESFWICTGLYAHIQLIDLISVVGLSLDLSLPVMYVLPRVCVCSSGLSARHVCVCSSCLCLLVMSVSARHVCVYSSCLATWCPVCWTPCGCTSEALLCFSMFRETRCVCSSQLPSPLEIRPS